MITKHLLGKCHFSIATHVINYSLHDFPRFIPGHQTFTNSFPFNVLLIQISFRYIHVFKMCCIWSNVNRHFPTILNQDLANGQIMWRSLVWTVLVIFIGIRHRYLFYCKRLADSSSHIPKGIATVRNIQTLRTNGNHCGWADSCVAQTAFQIFLHNLLHRIFF